MNLNKFAAEKQSKLKKIEEFERKYYNYVESDTSLELDENIINKLKNMKDKVKNETFVIAMFGAFSDGKSTIIQALTNEKNIKISPEPTTSEVESFHFTVNNHNTVTIVDTPGLFSENDIHTEATRNYISEANIILFAIDAMNPLKDSQEDTIDWLLNKLGKVDSTLFVLNKMDTVADIEDEKEFKNSSQIKKKQVYETLKQINTKIDKKNVLSIAADPFGLGLNYWLNEYQEDYYKISKLNELKGAISTYIDKYREKTQFDAVQSVLNDVVSRLKEENSNIITVKNEAIELEKNQLDNLRNQLNNFEENIKIGHGNIETDLRSLRDQLLLGVGNCSNEKELVDFFMRNFGEENYLLTQDIERIIENHTDSLIEDQKIILEEIEENARVYNEQRENLYKYSQQFGKQALNAFSKIDKKVLSGSILKTRDALNIPFKFKPWGAIKLSSNLKFAGGALTVGLDILNSYLELRKQNKWAEIKDEESEKISNYFYELNKQLDREEYKKTYFPMVNEYKDDLLQSQNLINELTEEITSLKQYNMLFENYK